MEEFKGSVAFEAGLISARTVEQYERSPATAVDRMNKAARPQQPSRR
jgi:hypothetical protein